jgi:uncharacterized protein with HEPN domain
MLQAIAEVRQFVAGMSFASFSADPRTSRAVAFDVAVIGEASGRIPMEVRARHPEVPWAQMRRMRNVLIHQYFGIDLQILWETAQQDLPALEVALRELLAKEATNDAGQ